MRPILAIQSVELKGVIGVMCAAVFGLVFIVAGLKRMFAGGSVGSKGESILWGTIGVVLGCAMIGGVAWMIYGPRPEVPDDQEFQNPISSPFIVNTTQP